VLAPARAFDKVLWKLGRRPARAPLAVTADGGVAPRNLLARGLLAAGGVRRRRA
jgi:hypothetical protein